MGQSRPRIAGWFINKARQVYVERRLTTREYEAKDGSAKGGFERDTSQTQAPNRPHGRAMISRQPVRLSGTGQRFGRDGGERGGMAELHARELADRRTTDKLTPQHCDRHTVASLGHRSSEKCVFLCRRRANPIRCEGYPIWEPLAFSYPNRCEPTPLDAPDHLSNVVLGQSP